jgi:hypothetical protein
MPDSDAAREVRLGIKTGAFYGQDACCILSHESESTEYLCANRSSWE